METIATLLLAIIKVTPKLELLFDYVVKKYVIERYKMDKGLFDEAEKKARAEKNTRELQKEIGKFLIIALILQGCATGAPAKSICSLDFESEMCWVDESHGVGYTFSDLSKQQLECSEAGTNVPCWYGIDSFDLYRIHERLSQGR